MTPIRTHLDDISTRWAVIGDPIQFVMRYAAAVRTYFAALTPDGNAADDACQDFLLNTLRQGFVHADPDRGRFRHYLKAAVRNALRMHFRRLRTSEELTDLAAPENADAEWTAQWRQCVLDRTWKALHHRQRRDGTNLYYTVLRTAVDFPDEDSNALAARVSRLVNTTIRPDAFRQQLSRARKLFTKLLVEEVAQTLDDRRPDVINEELAELGLLTYVQVDHEKS